MSKEFHVKGEETKNASDNQVNHKVRQLFDENPDLRVNFVIGIAIKSRLRKAFSPIINVYQTIPRITKQMILASLLMSFMAGGYLESLDYFLQWIAFAIVLAAVSFIWQREAMKASSSPVINTVAATKPPVENRTPARHTPTAEYINPLDYQQTVEIEALTTKPSSAQRPPAPRK